MSIVDFFDHPFFIVIGGLATLISVIGGLWLVMAWILGIGPVIWRLGIGRWTRKICIVAKDEFYFKIKRDLEDSGIFRGNNISQITDQTIDQVSHHSLILVHFKSYPENVFRRVLDKKSPSAGLIIYFPEFVPGRNAIGADMLNEINSKEFTTLVNHRGRLLNDVFTTLVTTGYGKRSS